MDDAAQFHQDWLRLAQPHEGLVVSLHALLAAQCAKRLPKECQLRLIELCPGPRGQRQLRSLPELLEQLLDLPPERFDSGQELPVELCLEVMDTGQTLRPTLALRLASPPEVPADRGPASVPAARAGAAYEMLIWEVPPGLDLDERETRTGPWEATAQAKFDRLLRACQVPLGLLSNSVELRLVYAPEDGASGYLPFRLNDMCEADGRPLLDAFVMLLHDTRWRGKQPEHRLPGLVKASRERQTDVTEDIPRQVFEALELLLAGFEVAAERDPEKRLDRTLQSEPDRVYAGLLTVVLRTIFLLYCEDKGLMPSTGLFREHYGINALFQQLQYDRDRHPDTMALRYGAYARLVALFRLVYLGGEHEGTGERPGLRLPERRGELFDPNEYPFLEGWGPGGSAPLHSPAERDAVALPAIDDGTVYQVLKRLVLLRGQRLSYGSLKVEQIGSVYEALMGYEVVRLEAGAVRLPLKGKEGYWLSGKDLLAQPAQGRSAWLKDELGFEKGMASKVAQAASGCKTDEQVLEKLEAIAGRRAERASPGRLVLQPGPARRRTSSHYTPPDLARSVVERALEPLLQTMGPAPRSESILNLVVCDPAMGSGAFLVAACEYLAGHLLAAWEREGRREQLGNAEEDARVRAKRLIAQRCLFGVDSNRYAVQLARMSLWLTTLSVHEPFTFVDHALRHGDSLVGVSLDQLRSFHWKPEAQQEFLSVDLRQAVAEALERRRKILDLARDPAARTSDKQRLLFQADDALSELRLVGDVLVGAFFAAADDKAREKERDRRAALVQRWLVADLDDEQRVALRSQLEALRAELRKTLTPFHWMLEFPEVFCDDRADPLDGDRRDGKAWVDAFIGNPPFLAGSAISSNLGAAYLSWLLHLHEGAHGNGDLSAHFFRRTRGLIGSNGTIGLVATKTIAQGDTRATGLERMVKDGFKIYFAHTNIPWPGEANVTVTLCHLATGTCAADIDSELNGIKVRNIDPRLRAASTYREPHRILMNGGLSYLGCKTYGQGFTLSPDERDSLVRSNRNNAQRIFPYLGGEEANTNPDQSHNRYVISFGQMDLAEAEKWPDLVDIVRKKVKPERDKNKRETRKRYWWRFGETASGLFAAIKALKRCLVTSRHTKHLVFHFQPTDRIFSEALCVFPLDAYTHFTVLQSRIHEAWARLLCSSMKMDLRYTPSDCFVTFPFPNGNPRALIPLSNASASASTTPAPRSCATPSRASPQRTTC